MRRTTLLFALLSLAPALLCAQATTPPATQPESQTCPATPTLDALIAALDAAITGPASKDRACFHQVLLPEVRLIPIGPDGPRILTVDDWIARVQKNGDAVVTEHQLKYQSETFGHIAHIWSTYSTTLAGKPVARGINSIQAVYDGQNWHIVEVLWQAENPTTPIPAQYLP